MKASNANKALSVLLSVAMCSMSVPTAAFATEGGAAADESSSVEQTQPVDQVEASMRTRTRATLLLRSPRPPASKPRPARKAPRPPSPK